MADWRRFAEHQMPLKLAVNVPASVMTARIHPAGARILPKDRAFPD